MATFNPIVVDLSHYDQVADLAAAKAAGLAGIIHKASQGPGWQDPDYASRRSQARDAGLLWGAYHFGTGAPVSDQVRNFLATAAPDPFTLLALDFEPNGDDTMSLDQARDFLSQVTAQTGRKPVLYSGTLIKQCQPRPDAFFGAHRLWLAEYCIAPKLPASWSSYWLWQYSGDGVGPEQRTLPGIPGNSDGQIDCNTFAGTLDELKAQWAG